MELEPIEGNIVIIPTEFSVIMPTYNRGYTIKRAVDSVLKQSYKNWELIIVDDGSTDNTSEILKKYADERIKYIRYEINKGANHARNIGLKKSKGRKIAFLDSDNAWEEMYLEKQNNFMKNGNVDISFCRMRRFTDDNNFHIFPDDMYIDFTESDIATKMCGGNIMDTNVTSIRRECFEKYGGFDEEIPRFQDWDYFLSLIEKGAVVIFNNEVLCNCHTMKDSISNNSAIMGEAFCKIIEKHYWFIREHGAADRIAVWMIDTFKVLGFYNFLNQLCEMLLADTWFETPHTIAIYGYGTRGRAVYTLLSNSGSTISAIVDRYCEGNNNDTFLPLYRDVDDLENLDAIVVTVEKECDEIISFLKKKTAIPIYSFYELMNFTNG